MILESGKNCTEAHLTSGAFGADDLHYVLDFDMAFLGANADIYDAHLENIRKEYSFLSDDEYKEQRLKVHSI